ncbi:MAG: DUF5658 family protein [Myxococcaceae bacterium]
MGVEGTAAGQRAARSRDVRVAALSLFLLFLNVVDGGFTTLFLQLGVASEVNPLMRLAYERSPVVFMLAKLALVQAGVLMLWVNRDARAARGALWCGVLLYLGIVGWHLCMLVNLLSG